MPRRLLVVCQKVDETDDLLGFFTAWLREFSRHYDEVKVITLARGEAELPPNIQVHSLGKEKGASKFRQAMRLTRLLWKLTPRGGAVFCHMSPVFALYAWPLARLRRNRLVLWYLHRSRTLKLRLALAVCDHLVTADAASLTVHSPKIISVGHGIDGARFAASGRVPPHGRPLRVISVGRLSPIKDFGTLIRAAVMLKERGVAMELRIVGKPVMKGDAEYASALKQMAEGRVDFAGFVPYRDMPIQYAWADVVVGCTPPGGLDKAILEGMAAGCVPVTSNDAMRQTLGADANTLLFPHGDAAALAERIAAIQDWAGLSRRAGEAVRERHDLARTVRRVSELT